uniref:Ovule protein n=1 Tax=Heterorhabditis bacteriophora TaxID=37862 RepID=A0A1I7WKW8_HETBA
MAHRIISHILRCFPILMQISLVFHCDYILMGYFRSNKTLLGTLQRNFPHSSHDIHRFMDYIRNIIQITEYACKIRQEIWALIIDQMVICDVSIYCKLPYDYLSNSFLYFILEHGLPEFSLW